LIDDNKQPADIAPMPGKQEGKPITQGLQTGKAREDYPFKDPGQYTTIATAFPIGANLGAIPDILGCLKEQFLERTGIAIDAANGTRKVSALSPEWRK
jgi:hypothetical protein